MLNLSFSALFPGAVGWSIRAYRDAAVELKDTRFAEEVALDDDVEGGIELDEAEGVTAFPDAFTLLDAARD